MLFCLVLFSKAMEECSFGCLAKRYFVLALASMFSSSSFFLLLFGGFGITYSFETIVTYSNVILNLMDLFVVNAENRSVKE